VLKLDIESFPFITMSMALWRGPTPGEDGPYVEQGDGRIATFFIVPSLQDQVKSRNGLARLAPISLYIQRVSPCSHSLVQGSGLCRKHKSPLLLVKSTFCEIFLGGTTFA
jgi:hypothetical protein